MDPDHLVRILHEPIGQLTDVDQTVLVDPDVDERTERGHIRHDAPQRHAWLQIVERPDVLAESNDFERLARVAARFGQLGQDVA